MSAISTPATPSSSRTWGSLWVWIAVGLSWIVGFVSNFIVAPTNTGHSVLNSYAQFQSGSNLGNVVALLAWTGSALWAGLHWSRSAGPTAIRALAAFGVPAVLSLYPAAVISAAVAHVIALEDGFVYQDWLARPLAITGMTALIVAATAHLLHRRRSQSSSQEM